MPRPKRTATGGYCYHVLNRGNARHEVFHKPADYAAFIRQFDEAENTSLTFLNTESRFKDLHVHRGICKSIELLNQRKLEGAPAGDFSQQAVGIGAQGQIRSADCDCGYVGAHLYRPTGRRLPPVRQERTGKLWRGADGAFEPQSRIARYRHSDEK